MCSIYCKGSFLCRSNLSVWQAEESVGEDGSCAGLSLDPLEVVVGEMDVSKSTRHIILNDLLPSCHAVNVIKLFRLPANSTEVCQGALEALICAREDDLSVCQSLGFVSFAESLAFLKQCTCLISLFESFLLNFEGVLHGVVH